MKTNVLKTTLFVCALAGAAWPLLAGPLQRADVAADPAWVLHLDCDSLRPTAIGQYLLAEMEKPEAQAKFAAFQTIFNFDPRKQLHGLTLYSAGKAEDDAVALVYADFNSERLAALAKSARDSQSAPHKAHLIYSWIEDGKEPKDGVMPRTYAAIHGSRVVVFARQEKPVANALDVLDNALPNLSAGKVFPQLGAPGGASFIEASARKLEFADSTPTAAIFRVARFMRLDVGETNRTVTARLNIETSDASVAKQTAAVVQGFLALVKLQRNKPEAGKLAEALSLKQDGASLAATLALPAADVAALLKTDTDKKAPQKPEKN